MPRSTTVLRTARRAARGAAAAPFRSLGVRNFRLFAVGQVVSVAGTWMMATAQDWLVLSLTGDSATALGTVTALQFAPMALLTLYGGRLADRHDKRRLLVAANLASAALSLALAVPVLTGAAGLGAVYACALGLGVVNAVEVPTRMSFVSELVGPELLPNASALSAAYFNVARVAGPALAGVLIGALGPGGVMLLNGVSYAGTVAGLLLIRPAELLRGPGPGRAGRVVDGLRYVRERPDLLAVLGLLAAAGVFAFTFQLSLPLLAKGWFHDDPAAFGLLSTAFAAGSLAAALATTMRTGRPAARAVAGAALALGLLEVGTGLAPSAAVAAGALVLTGFAAVYFAQAANHRVQLGSAPALRGRVMALYTLILQGSTPLGALLFGLVAERLGVRVGLCLGGLAVALAALPLLSAGRGRSVTVPVPPARSTASTPTTTPVPTSVSEMEKS
ncbi:MFS transporter [Kitasatospora sp. NPDC088391]|uniref:MFS transporter n=1 Tax=Kitasatospora sp. NPDC088391 TaxID=3364074 RepID=UPI00382D4C37